jgi:adenine phosphoribosyltransferase
MNGLDLKAHIRGVPDFPKPGILFYDIGTLLAHGPAWRETMDRLGKEVEAEHPDVLLGIESRGFLVAAPLASALGVGVVMVRKKGKLPGKTVAHSYALEYGTDTIEIQEGILRPGQRAVLLDDLLATGGTAAAALALARQMGVNVARAAFIIELAFLQGRARIDVPVTSLVSYEN